MWLGSEPSVELTSPPISTLRPDHQALSGVFVDQVQHPHHPSVVSLRAYEVVRPYMVGVLRSQPHARSIVEPQPPLVIVSSLTGCDHAGLRKFLNNSLGLNN